uniref:Ig-like domain-containing protein n=1 Tax=Pseudonaja textilis TaxID=8673 RepID=A0A670ZKL5_PSETE
MTFLLPPVGKVTHKVEDERLEVLICQAFGFYPKEIRATWRKDREICKYEAFHRNVAPNSDGTYYVWLSIKIDPKERDRFRCHLEHEGLQEPLVLAWKEERGESLRGWTCRSRFFTSVGKCAATFPIPVYLRRFHLPLEQ